MEKKIILNVRNLFKSYKETTILKNLELEVCEGEVFAVIGHNGAGKSTLIEILAGMEKGYKGEINILGYAPGDDRIKTKIFILSEKLPILWHIKVKELIKLFCYLYNLEKIEYLPLKELNLQGKEERFVRNLSKGELQGLFIALALMVDSPIMLLDEPTSGLDPKMRMVVWELLTHRVNIRKTTIFYTTHYLQEAYEWADRVAIINKGSILKIGRTKEIIEEVVNTKERISFPKDSILPDFDYLVKHKVFTHKRVIFYPVDCEEFIFRLMKNGIREFRVEKTSLEDVFLILTGEEYVAD